MRVVRRSVIVKTVLLSFFAGVGLGSVMDAFWATVLFVFLYTFVIIMLRLGSGYTCFWLWFGGCVAFIVGLIRILVTVPVFDVGDIGFYTDIEQQVSLEARVAGQPEIRNQAQYLLVEALRLESAGLPGLDVQGKVLVKAALYPEYAYGDFVRISGQLQKPAEFKGFSYADYLAKDAIYAVMYRPWVELVEEIYYL